MAFVFDIQTSGTDDTFTLPLTSNGTYDFNVDWGDTSDDDITAYNDAAITHTYATEGEYTITITGTITGWRFNNSSSAPKVRDVSDWGSLDVGANTVFFYGCSNMTVSATGMFGISSVTSFYYAFRDCSSLTTLDVSSWDVSSVTSFSYAFTTCSSLTTLDVSSWDVSSVTDFFAAFYNCSGLTTLDVSSWDVSSVTSFSNAFNNCSSLTTLDVSSWDVSSVTSFSYAFRECSSLTTLDVSSWDVSSVTSFSYAFKGCSGLTDEIYSKALVNWSQQDLNSSVTAHFGTAKYYKGAPTQKRGYLSIILSWAITDGGQSAYRYPSDIEYIKNIIQKKTINNSAEFVFLTESGETLLPTKFNQQQRISHTNIRR